MSEDDVADMMEAAISDRDRKGAENMPMEKEVT